MTTETIEIVADYGLTVEEIVKIGDYDYACPTEITSSNFKTARSGVHQLEAVLVNFDRIMSSEQVLAELDTMGLRAGELHELLAVGAQHPGKQLEFTIVALCSEVNVGGGRVVPYLGRWVMLFYVGRKLDLHWFGSRWRESCHFLAFPK